MARLILKSPYLKPGGKKSPGGYLKYIATREGVEMAEDTSRHLPATTEQQKQITKLLKKYPDSKDCHEYQDYPKRISNLKHLGMTFRMTLNAHSVGQGKIDF